jgi:hypothetical protein
VELMVDTLSFEAVVDLMFECVDALITRRTRSFNPGAKLPKPSLAEARDSRAMVKALQPLPFRACVTVENISLKGFALGSQIETQSPVSLCFRSGRRLDWFSLVE